jgi:4-amino-4-deoxychorismate lyase
MLPVWVSQDEAAGVHPLDRAIAYGDGVFATMRSKDAKILYLDRHLQRLVQSCQRLAFQWQASDALVAKLGIFAREYPNHCIKLIVSRGLGGRGYTAPTADKLKPTEILCVSELPSHYRDWQQKGIALAISDIKLGRQPRLAGIKHLNRLEQVLIKSQPLSNEEQDFLVLDSLDNVIETAMANVFFVKNEAIYTPALNYAGVSGVTRELIIEALLSLGHNVIVGPIHLDFVRQAEHIFISNSLFGIVDVVKLAGQNYQPWKTSMPLRQSLEFIL